MKMIDRYSKRGLWAAADLALMALAGPRAAHDWRDSCRQLEAIADTMRASAPNYADRTRNAMLRKAAALDAARLSYPDPERQ